MGTIISPNCIASDGTKLYAHYVSLYPTQTVFLAESSSNPSTITDISWKIISYIPQSKLYYLQGLAQINSFACGVDSKGVFTVLSLSAKASSTDQLPAKPRGYQYNPTTNNWTNIDMTNNYKWSFFSNSVLINVPNGNTNVLMHVYSTNLIDNTITFSIYNETQRTFIEQNTTWAASATPHEFAVSNNNLYVVSADDMTSTVYLNIMPLNPTATPPSNASIKTLKGSPSLYTNCGTYSPGSLRSGVLGSNHYLYCGGSVSAYDYLVTSDGTNITDPIQLPIPVNAVETFIPFSGSGGAPAWAFMNNSTNVFGLGLTGANKATWDFLSYQVNATGYPSSGGSGTGGSGSGGNGIYPSSSSSSGGLSQPALIGIIAGCIVLLVLAIALIRRRRLRKSAEKVQIVDTTNGTPFVATQDYNYQPPIFVPQIFQPQEQQQLQQQQQQLQQQQQGAYYDPEKSSQSPLTTTEYGAKHFSPTATTAQIVPNSMQQMAQNPQEYPASTTTPQGPQSTVDSNTIASWSPVPSNGSTLNSPYSNNPQLYSMPMPMLEVGLYASDPRNPQSFPQVAAPQDFGGLQPQLNGPQQYMGDQQYQQYQQYYQ
ncbi:hypothetical protein BGX26_001266 [Mortierella sp. AD094]|nr:hypothetical protein BGX26_001266 [Mortierella sp. AD094]